MGVGGLVRRPKVVAYVVDRGRLLVFTHADDASYDVSGLQVPAGSVEPGEVPERWYAEERGGGDPIRFALFWIPLAHAHSVAAGQAALVGRMYDRPTPHLTG